MSSTTVQNNTIAAHDQQARQFVTDFCFSCLTCSLAKSVRLNSQGQLMRDTIILLHTEFFVILENKTNRLTLDIPGTGHCSVSLFVVFILLLFWSHFQIPRLFVGILWTNGKIPFTVSLKWFSWQKVKLQLMLDFCIPNNNLHTYSMGLLVSQCVAVNHTSGSHRLQ